MIVVDYSLQEVEPIRFKTPEIIREMTNIQIEIRELSIKESFITFLSTKMIVSNSVNLPSMSLDIQILTVKILSTNVKMFSRKIRKKISLKESTSSPINLIFVETILLKMKKKAKDSGIQSTRLQKNKKDP